MRYLDGFDFKSNTLSGNEKSTLEMNIAGWDDHASNVYIHKHGKKTYLASCVQGDLSIYGIGNINTGDTRGIIWGNNEKAMIQTAYNLGWDNVFPYKVIPHLIYTIYDGECFLTEFKVGAKVETPLGKGRIYSIDNVISIELEDDASILHEFDVNEISAIKEEK